jgi:hypothetical protein
MNFSASYLFANVLWGSIGVGFFIYGKKQSSFVPLIGGVAMIGVSYFINSALLMSLVSVAIIGAIWFLSDRL